MTESRILWLAIGVFVGYVIWGERRKHYGGMANMVDVTDSGGFSDGANVGTNPNPSFASCGGTC